MAEFSAEAPVGLSLLVADRVYREANTGKWIIAGVFSTLHTQQLPVTVARMEVFFQVTNISRAVDLKLRIEHADEGERLFEFGGPIKARGPLEVIARKVEMINVPFKSAGKYWVQLTSNELIVVQAPLYVVKAEPKSDPGASPHPPQDDGGERFERPS